MFTGIIQKTAKIQAIERMGKNLRVEIETPKGWKLTSGQSIAVDGVCLTVISKRADSFSADAMPETLKKTTVGSFSKGRVVNLERALKLSDLLDGHLVQGHVDGRGKVTGIKNEGASLLLTVDVPAGIMKHVALHGSITLNGVSLTVARIRANTVTVALVPYTLSHTNLSLLAKGDGVNIETDFLLRHLAAQKRAKVSGRNGV
jgi:riboflavin synthase